MTLSSAASVAERIWDDAFRRCRESDHHQLRHASLDELSICKPCVLSHITTALAEARREVWEAAAQVLETFYRLERPNKKHAVDRNNQIERFAEEFRCRSRAQEGT